MMQIITITIEQDEDTTRVGFNASDGVTPQMGESACRFVAARFQEVAIEAEIERRLKERGNAEDTGP